MDKSRALSAFAALSQETRLDVLRLLVRRGAEGALSGEIGAALGVRQNTMSGNLSILRQAGLPGFVAAECAGALVAVALAGWLFAAPREERSPAE